MNRLEVMCRGIQRVLAADDARGRAAANTVGSARALTKHFALTHRAAGAAKLDAILSTQRLHAKPSRTRHEHDCGLERAIYFFLGCAAYPEGTVVFLVRNHLLERMPASYSPFDSGSLPKHASPRDPLRPWGDPEKHAFLESHLGEGSDAVAFSAEYIAAHFEDAMDYVFRPQQSEPDFPTYHDLVSTTGDRRAWSIEVRLHEDLELDAEHIEAIVIARGDFLLYDFPEELFDKVVIAEDKDEITPTVQRLILSERTS